MSNEMKEPSQPDRCATVSEIRCDGENHRYDNMIVAQCPRTQPVAPSTESQQEKITHTASERTRREAHRLLDIAIDRCCDDGDGDTFATDDFVKAWRAAVKEQAHISIGT